MSIDFFDIPDALVIKDTPQAILVEAPGFFDDPVWVPKSQVHEDSEVWEDSDEGRGPGTLYVTTWFAEKEGWM